MKTVKILIVENEHLTAQRIRITLERANYLITELVSSGEDAIRSIKSESPDLILMDIHLDGKIDGITTAAYIKKRYDLPVIFITQWEDKELFENAKETLPQNYLIKPFNDTTLINAIELALKHLENDLKKLPSSYVAASGEGVFIPTEAGINVKLLFKDILYIKANGAYSDIYYEGEDNIKSYHRISISSNHVSEQLANPSLFKIHRSYYINILKIDKIFKSSVFIKGDEIPATEELIQILKNKLIFLKR